MAFDIDANGILNVKAKDLGTGKEQQITITASSGLTEEEIKRKIREAEQHAEEDRKQKEKVELRNQADTLIYTVEKTMKESEDKITAEEKDKINEDIKKLRSALEKDDIDEIKRGIEELTASSHKLAEEIYKKASAQSQQAGGATQSSRETETEQAETSEEKGEEKVVDADYEVKNDDDK